MSVQDRYNSVESNLNNKLDALLSESRNDMLECTQAILHGIDSHAMEAKKDVRHHISQLVKVQSAVSGSSLQ